MSEGLKQKIRQKAKTFRTWYSEQEKYYNNGDYADADKILDGEFVMVDDVVALLDEQATQIRESTTKWAVYQCEKCGFIDTSTREEFEALPKEQKEYLMNHRKQCGGRFVQVILVPLKEVFALLVGKEEGEKKQT